MKARHRLRSGESGLTWVEVLTLIVIGAVLYFVAMGGFCHVPVVSARSIEMFSNMRKLHLAAQAMVLDGTTMEEPVRSWPGDLGGSFSKWSEALTARGYLSTNEFTELLSAPGERLWDKAKAKNRGVLVYAVRDRDDGSVVFLSSANFTNTPDGGKLLAPASFPYGDKRFVVFRKGGDGASLMRRQAGNTNVIGSYAPLCW